MNQDDKNNKEINLSDELKDSDNGGKIQNNEQQQSIQTFFPETPKIIQLTIKYSCGLIKNEKQANYVLIGFAALAIIVSLFLVFGGRETISKKPPVDLINKPQPEEGHIPR